MSGKNETLMNLIEPVVQSFGLQLWGMHYVPQGAHSLLRIFIDGENGVNIEDCAKVSRQLSAVLDVEDPINGKYTLEVSSPGLDRPLFTLPQYSGFVGKVIKLKLNRTLEIGEQKRKKFKTTLLAVNEGEQSLKIDIDGESVDIDFLNIEKANVVGDFA